MLRIDIPMPNSCRDCMFSTPCSFCEGLFDYCILARDEERTGYNKNGESRPYWDFDNRVEPKDIPHWCPLREVVRCKDCKHRIVNEHYGERGYMRVKAFCALDTGDPFQMGRCAEEDDWYCADGKRKDGTE